MVAFVTAVFVSVANPPLSYAGWPTEFTADFNFYSTDMTPITVVLHSLNEQERSLRTILHVPRAAIVYASNYHPSQSQPQLPDMIDTDHIQIAVTFPDGKPLSVRGHQLGAEQHVDDFTAIKSLRSQEYVADIYYAYPDWERIMLERKKDYQIVDRYKGLPHALGDYYLGQSGVDQFALSYCFTELRPEYFCRTELRIGPSLVGNVSFLDFRLHGGRTFLNDRAKKIREIVCGYAEPPCTSKKNSRKVH